MLTDFNGADRVYIACGYTDLHHGIDCLAAMVQQQFDLERTRGMPGTSKKEVRQ